MRIILWTIAAIVSSVANGKFLLLQNDPYFAYRCLFIIYFVLLPYIFLNFVAQLKATYVCNTFADIAI